MNSRNWFLTAILTASLSFASEDFGAAFDHSDLDRGVQLYEAGKFQDAESALSAAVEADPASARAVEYLGRTRLELRKYTAALTDLTKADELSPDNDAVKIGLARVYLEQKQLDKAEREANRAAELNDSNPDVPLYRGAIAVAKRDYRNAAKLLEQAAQKKPDSAYAHYYAGLAYNGLKQPDKMVEHFRTFLKLAPDAPEAPKVESLLRATR
ncbi:MAG: tetratricopeptide repeat protein [Bryobacteraceae bacterium]